MPDEDFLLGIPEFDGTGARAFITTRHGGHSAHPYDTLNLGLHVEDDETVVIQNRSIAAATAGFELDDLVFMDQVHGTTVAEVGESDRGRGARSLKDAVAGTDALVTRCSSLPLVVLVADCSPVVLVDPANKVLGVAHAGWRGSVAGVITATVDAMKAAGADAGCLIAHVGPTIEANRYEVGSEVADEFTASFASDAGQIVINSLPRPHLDLVEANVVALRRAGIPSDQISRSGFGTDDPRVFSDRHARPCGRFGIIAWLEQ
jgi:hypothetical protein